MEDDDEVDVLGEFTLENLLTKNDNRIWSCYEGDCYEPGSHWLQESAVAAAPCWQEDRSLFANPLMSTGGGSDGKEDVWTDKECYLLDKGLELFGRSWSRLAQYIGSKTSQQVRSRVKGAGGPSGGGGGASLSAGLSSLDLPTCSALDQPLCFSELIDDLQIPASIEEVIATVTTARPTVQNSPPSGRQRHAPAPPSPSAPAHSFSSGRAPVSSHGHRAPPAPAKKPRGRPRKEHAKDTSRPRKEKSVKLPSLLASKERRPPPSSSSVSDSSVKRTKPPILPYALAGEENCIVLPSGEQVIRIQRVDSLEDDEVDVEDHSDGEREAGAGAEVAAGGCGATEAEASQPVWPPERRTLSASSIQAAAVSSYVTTIQRRLEEVYRLPAPAEERTLDAAAISEEEERLHPEFFARGGKNVRRYLKIRNHIVDCWLASKPAYVTKTSVRLGLKNCGDVNLMSRVHAYLEQRGYVNFGCGQCHYLTARCGELPVENGKATVCSGAKANETDKTEAKEVGGDATRKIVGGHELRGCNTKSCKPFDGSDFGRPSGTAKTERRPGAGHVKLITCREFSPENPEPFRMVLKAGALIVANCHAHADARTEVAGLLGGTYDADVRVLRADIAVPCQSLAASRVSCEMCPVSQSEASERIHGAGLRVIGWYHSHPNFRPEPSDVDIRTQADHQAWFAPAGHPFVSLVISPHGGECSLTDHAGIDFRLVYVKEKSPEALVPYRLRPAIDSSGLCEEDVVGCNGQIPPAVPDGD